MTKPLITTAFNGRKSKNKVRVRGGRERNQIAAILRTYPLVDVTEVGRFAAERGTVVNDFELNLAAGVIDDRHGKARFADRFGKDRSHSLKFAHGHPGLSFAE